MPLANRARFARSRSSLRWNLARPAAAAEPPVTLKMLERAALALDKRLHIELV